MRSLRRIQVGIAVAAVGLGVGVLLAVAGGQHNIHRGAYAALALGIGWGFTGTGLYAWKRRPASNIGPLMIAVGFAGLLKTLAFSNDSVIFTIGSLGEVLIYALLIHLLLSFPSGRLDSRVDRVLVSIAYFNTIVVQFAAFVFTDPTAQGCPQCPANPLLIDHADAAAGVIGAAQLDIAVAVLGAVVAILYRRWRDSSPSQRRAFAPVLAVGSLTFLLLMSSLIVEQAGLPAGIDDGLTLALFGSLACLPFAFLLGLVRSRFSQAEAVSSLVARLGSGGGRGVLRDALAEALGDPSVELAYWVPNQDAYVDGEGQPMRIDPVPTGRIATAIEHEGTPIAAILHDAELADDLVQAVGAAAALTLENERLDAELRAHVEQLRASRARIVTAGYAERRRVERDLHDGAQQRLMALGINLRMARNQIGSDAHQAAALIDASLEELKEATAELRELARGIHPAALTDRGLAAALGGLAGRSPVPVDLVEAPHERLPAPVESAVYFVVAEALTNVARYARANKAIVTVARSNDHVHVQISDDGIGGADPARGSGLRGLSDRVAALDGRLELASADGDGTTVRASIPCA